jgi:hypothetical protein
MEHPHVQTVMSQSQTEQGTFSDVWRERLCVSPAGYQKHLRNFNWSVSVVKVGWAGVGRLCVWGGGVEQARVSRSSCLM